MKAYLKPRYLVPLFFLFCFIFLMGFWGYGRSLSRRPIPESSFASYIKDSDIYDVKERQRIAKYTSPVSVTNESSYALVKKNHVELLNRYMIGTIYIPKVNSALPVSTGTGAPVSFIGVTEPRQGQTMGEGLWLGTSSVVEGIDDYPLRYLPELEPGDKIYITNGVDTFTYKITRSDMTDSIKSIMDLAEVLGDGSSKMMLYQISSDSLNTSRVLYNFIMADLVDEAVPEDALRHLGVHADSSVEPYRYSWFQDLALGFYGLFS